MSVTAADGGLSAEQLEQELADTPLNSDGSVSRPMAQSEDEQRRQREERTAAQLRQLATDADGGLSHAARENVKRGLTVTIPGRRVSPGPLTTEQLEQELAGSPLHGTDGSAERPAEVTLIPGQTPIDDRPPKPRGRGRRTSLVGKIKPRARKLQHISSGGVQFDEDADATTPAEMVPALGEAGVDGLGVTKGLVPTVSLPPIPYGVDLATPGIVEAWRLFLQLDQGNKRVLSYELISELAFFSTEKSFSTRKMKAEMEDANGDHKLAATGADFHQYSRWLSRFQAVKRREVRRLVKENFELYDKDNSGILDKREFAQVVEKSRKHMNVIVDIDEDWEAIAKVPMLGEEDDDGNFEEGVTFNDFERWWKERAGIVEPDIPVLPEFMVMRIAEKSRGMGGWTGNARREEKGSPGSHRTSGTAAKRRWQSLGASLRTLVDMKRQWGALHEMYETRAESLYDILPLPGFVLDPDSPFSQCWDLASIMFLMCVPPPHDVVFATSDTQLG